MKQILQNLKTGMTEILEVPPPIVGRGQVLIQSTRTILSSGTERTLLDFGKSGWIAKARQQPEKVKQVLDKIKTDGIVPTVEAVFNKLDEPMSPGYCNAGVVLEVGVGVTDLRQGDRVISNGPHAEIVCVPRNLCAKIPDGVQDEDAAFTVLASIALQGVRLAMPELGERFMVFGLGMVGLLTCQLLQANGCSVMAVDISKRRLQLAASFGAEIIDIGTGKDPVAVALSWTGGNGVDGVIICASAKDDEIVHQAAQACRRRGRIVLVGVVDLNLRRADFYEKELSFQVSCSYGPGRYDEKYEQGGQDYPFGFVRWTEQRNFEAVLEAMRSGKLRVTEMITHRLVLDEAAAMYDKLLHDPEALGIVIEYLSISKDKKLKVLDDRLRENEKNEGVSVCDLPAGNGVRVGVIGAGNYARATLLPALYRTTAIIAAVADINGVAASYAARKYEAKRAISDYSEILKDPGINAVFILVGHHLHARFICEVLESGKHVFVEKPLAINADQLTNIMKLYEKSNIGYHTQTASSQVAPMVMVGFNRRFSRHTLKIRELLAGRNNPLAMTITVNAGFIPPEHWTQDAERGGGRIIGEGCHFIDLLSYLAMSPATQVSAQMIGGNDTVREDKMSILLRFADGSVGTVHYFANGSKNYPKETLEIFSDGRVIRMENFRVTTGFGFKGFRKFRTWRQDKGHSAEISEFINAVASGAPSLIPFDEIVNVTKASFAAVEAARTGKVISI
jgi:predicted dehydrogenase/threonine dehydrogenase-like Zn-dependent dehydrogenase